MWPLGEARHRAGVSLMHSSEDPRAGLPNPIPSERPLPTSAHMDGSPESRRGEKGQGPGGGAGLG